LIAARAQAIIPGAKIGRRESFCRSITDNPVVWAQQQRVPGAFNGFLLLPSDGEGQTETRMRQCEIRIQLQRAANARSASLWRRVRHRIGPAPYVPKDPIRQTYLHDLDRGVLVTAEEASVLGGS